MGLATNSLSFKRECDCRYFVNKISRIAANIHIWKIYATRTKGKYYKTQETHIIRDAGAYF